MSSKQVGREAGVIDPTVYMDYSAELSDPEDPKHPDYRPDGKRRVVVNIPKQAGSGTAGARALRSLLGRGYQLNEQMRRDLITDDSYVLEIPHSKHREYMAAQESAAESAEGRINEIAEPGASSKGTLDREYLTGGEIFMGLPERSPSPDK